MHNQYSANVCVCLCVCVCVCLCVCVDGLLSKYAQ